MSEKIGGAEGTKFTDEYTEMERVSFFLINILFVAKNCLLYRVGLYRSKYTKFY